MNIVSLDTLKLFSSDHDLWVVINEWCDALGGLNAAKGGTRKYVHDHLVSAGLILGTGAAAKYRVKFCKELRATVKALAEQAQKVAKQLKVTLTLPLVLADNYGKWTKGPSVLVALAVLRDMTFRDGNNEGGDIEEDSDDDKVEGDGEEEAGRDDAGMSASQLRYGFRVQHLVGVAYRFGKELDIYVNAHVLRSAIRKHLLSGRGCITPALLFDWIGNEGLQSRWAGLYAAKSEAAVELADAISDCCLDDPMEVDVGGGDGDADQEDRAAGNFAWKLVYYLPGKKDQIVLAQGARRKSTIHSPDTKFLDNLRGSASRTLEANYNHKVAEIALKLEAVFPYRFGIRKEFYFDGEELTVRVRIKERWAAPKIILGVNMAHYNVPFSSWSEEGLYGILRVSFTLLSAAA